MALVAIIAATTTTFPLPLNEPTTPTSPAAGPQTQQKRSAHAEPKAMKEKRLRRIQIGDKWDGKQWWLDGWKDSDGKTPAIAKRSQDTATRRQTSRPNPEAVESVVQNLQKRHAHAQPDAMNDKELEGKTEDILGVKLGDEPDGAAVNQAITRGVNAVEHGHLSLGHEGGKTPIGQGDPMEDKPSFSLKSHEGGTVRVDQMQVQNDVKFSS
ncbi:MAG: hypothetical protein M1831_006435 [Alyxoria varia]|nr:MAG: hypothetical protein M1831_006435 [Alyxoria varia]